MSKVPVPPATSKPDNSELWALSETLGIDLPAEKHLLHIVRAAMKAELPIGWTQHKDANDGEKQREAPSRWGGRLQVRIWSVATRI